MIRTNGFESLRYSMSLGHAPRVWKIAMTVKADCNAYQGRQELQMFSKLVFKHRNIRNINVRFVKPRNGWVHNRKGLVHFCSMGCCRVKHFGETSTFCLAYFNPPHAKTGFSNKCTGNILTVLKLLRDPKMVTRVGFRQKFL